MVVIHVAFDVPKGGSLGEQDDDGVLGEQDDDGGVRLSSPVVKERFGKCNFFHITTGFKQQSEAVGSHGGHDKKDEDPIVEGE
jgi:hypothetical protein